MSERLSSQEWRARNEPTSYPFSNATRLTSDDGRVLLEGTFLDAALYPVGAGANLRLTKVDVAHDRIRVWIGDATETERAYGEFDFVPTQDDVWLQDAYGRPAGVLVSSAERLGVFQSWGIGTHAFRPGGAEFCASCCIPVPEQGVAGILLDDGSFFTGDVWIVGSDGVVVRAVENDEIRFDVVGDPLFRRRLCEPSDLFQTPRFVQTIRVVGPGASFDVAPGDTGNLAIVANDALAADSVLRVAVTATGVRIGALGSLQQE